MSLSGGEPLIHPDIEEIVAGIIARKKHIHFCTNGLLLERSLDKFKPGPYMNFVLHMDGLAETHDSNAGRPGIFDTAVNGIKAAKQRGFRVLTNTTIFRNTDFSEIESLFELLDGLGVDGFMISPAFDFETVPDGAMFLSRDEINRVFTPLSDLRKRFRFYNTSSYLDFLQGNKDARCIPWSTPTLTPAGWRQPCYLLADEHCESYRELMDETDWDRYGVGRDPRCSNCMVHSGFEAGLIERAKTSLPELFQLARS